MADNDWLLRSIFIMGSFLLVGLLSEPGPEHALSTRTLPSKNRRSRAPLITGNKGGFQTKAAHTDFSSLKFKQ